MGATIFIGARDLAGLRDRVTYYTQKEDEKLIMNETTRAGSFSVSREPRSLSPGLIEKVVTTLPVARDRGCSSSFSSE